MIIVNVFIQFIIECKGIFKGIFMYFLYFDKHFYLYRYVKRNGEKRDMLH